MTGQQSSQSHAGASTCSPKASFELALAAMDTSLQYWAHFYKSPFQYEGAFLQANLKCMQGLKLTFLCERQVATEIFFSVNFSRQMENSGSQKVSVKLLLHSETLSF